VFTANITCISEPTSYDAASKDPRWQTAMQELEALQCNHTWDIIDLPNGKKPIGCKWVYRIKYKSDGTIDKFKARLVAKGFSQVQGLDYHETYSPVARMSTLRFLLSITAAKNWYLHQLDVDNAFYMAIYEKRCI
jgi:hypothetical protein